MDTGHNYLYFPLQIFSRFRFFLGIFPSCHTWDKNNTWKLVAISRKLVTISKFKGSKAKPNQTKWNLTMKDHDKTKNHLDNLAQDMPVFHSGETVDCGLPNCYTMQTCTWFPMFQRNMLLHLQGACAMVISSLTLQGLTQSVTNRETSVMSFVCRVLPV